MKRSRILFVVALVLIVLVSKPASARFVPDKLESKPSPSERSYDDACRSVAGAIITDVVDPDLAKNVAICNKSEGRQMCLSTRAFIIDNHKDPGGLTCK